MTPRLARVLPLCVRVWWARRAIRRSFGAAAFASLPVEEQLALVLWAGGTLLWGAVGTVIWTVTGDPAPLAAGSIGANLAGAAMFLGARYANRGWRR